VNILSALRAWRKSEILIVLLLFVTLLIFRCGFGGPTQSGSGGTGTEIIGTAEYSDDGGASKTLAQGSVRARTALPVIAGKVFIYPRFSVPDTSWSRIGALPEVYTGDNGEFHILNPPKGEVMIEVNDGSGKGSSKSWNVEQDSVIYRIGVLKVAPTGGISIQALSSLSGRLRFYVGICGTRFIARGDQTGVNVTLTDIPQGTGYVINVRVFEPVFYEFNISNVSISAGTTTVLNAIQIR
jgi:hypothetical protein